MSIENLPEQAILYAAMGRCSVFEGIAQDQYPRVLRCLESEIRVFAREEALVNIGDTRHMSGILLKGCISQTLMDENGNCINVDHIREGEVFGADRAVSDWQDSIVELRAVTECRVLFLNFSVLLQPNTTNCPNRARMTTNLLRDLARRSLFLNQRLQIMGQKKLRDKIKVYLQTLHFTEHSTELPFSRSELADYLYADRSALSRELGRMREEGIIAMKGRRITILSPDFLSF